MTRSGVWRALRRRVLLRDRADGGRVRTGVSTLVIAALLATPAGAQVGRTKERPTPSKPKAVPAKPVPASPPPAPREPWTSAVDVPQTGIFPSSVAWNPNGPLLAIGDGRSMTIQFRDAGTGEVKGTVVEPGRGGIYTLSFSRQGAPLAVGGLRGGDSLLWLLHDERGRKTELKGHVEAVTAIAWSPDGSRLASASWDGSVRVWQTESGEKLLLLAAHGGMVHDVAYGGDRFLATACEDGVVRVWNARTGDLYAALRGHTGAVRAVSFGGDERTVASCGADGTVRLWDLQKKAARAVLRAHKGGVWAMRWTDEGTRLASAGEDGAVRVWNNAGQEVSAMSVAKPLRSIAWAPDGQSIAAGDADGSIHVWKRSS
jgi:WD40 repeat protein